MNRKEGRIKGFQRSELGFLEFGQNMETKCSILHKGISRLGKVSEDPHGSSLAVRDICVSY